MIHNLSVFQLIPMDVLHFKALSCRINPYEHGTVDRKFADALVRARHRAAHNDRIIRSDRLDYFHAPVRKRRENVGKDTPKAVASYRPAVIFRVLGILVQRSFHIAAVQTIMMLNNNSFVRCELLDRLSKRQQRSRQYQGED